LSSSSIRGCAAERGDGVGREFRSSSPSIRMRPARTLSCDRALRRSGCPPTQQRTDSALDQFFQAACLCYPWSKREKYRMPCTVAPK
jgi:hypothetical protein